MSALLNERLDSVKWGEYKVTDVFEVKNTQSILSRDLVLGNGETPYLCASSENNAVCSYVSYDERLKDEGNCVFIGGKTFVVSYQEKDFYSNDSHNLALYLKEDKRRTKSVQLFLAACIYRGLKHKYSWGNSISNRKIQDDTIWLPVKDGLIDYDFMAQLVAELEAQRQAELEAYLLASRLKDTALTVCEKRAIEAVNGESTDIKWEAFNLEKLFGKAVRGKRLKSADRKPGSLPFVTAGETNEGISDFIGNDVEVFPKNTITIDMFGSAKYRCYEYGGDDHIAVVHTEGLSENAAVFVTAAIHKVSHNGLFNYGHNFYPKDADELCVLLPVRDGKPDFELMDTYISGVKKIVVKSVVDYADKKIETTKHIISE